MNLVYAVRSEILKTKRTASFYLTLIAGAFGPLMSLLDILMDGLEGHPPEGLLNEMFTKKFEMTGVAMLPIFIILVCTLLPQIEYRNNAWKQVLTAPLSKAHVFLAKFINIQVMIVLFLLANQFMIFVDCVILHFKEPAWQVLNQPIDLKKVVLTLVNSYGALLALCSIQFWLGMRFKNFIIPIAIGLACWFFGTILALQAKMAFTAYFPYSFHVHDGFPNYRPWITSIGWMSFGYAVLFLVLGFLDFRKRRFSA
ncbi:MAG TPA: ABC transporter permease [Flavisolibacter sp.]|jgi:hypothetical protein|nr:ABC transporter permease [Flavisolibacter sp.]